MDGDIIMNSEADGGLEELKIDYAAGFKNDLGEALDVDHFQGENENEIC